MDVEKLYVQLVREINDSIAKCDSAHDVAELSRMLIEYLLPTITDSESHRDQININKNGSVAQLDRAAAF